MEKKKASTKNQHYVPQFYQRNFSNDEKSIGIYLLNQKKYVPTAAIKHQASSDYFYSQNLKIEDALGFLENLAAIVIEKIKQNPTQKLKNEDAMALYVFTMIQIGRTQAFVRMMTDNANKMGKLMLRKHIEAMRKTDKANKVEYITDDILDSVSIQVNEPGRFALSTISQLIDLCIDMVDGGKILINKTSKSFISSDNPACMYDQHLERIGNLNYALGSSGLQIYLPLTPTLAVMYYDNLCYKLGDRKKNYIEITQEQDVIQLNRLVACTANEVIFTKHGNCSISDLDNYAAAHLKYHITDPVQTFEISNIENGKIIGASHCSMYCKLHLTFIKELPKFKIKTPLTFNNKTDLFRKSVYSLDRYRE